MSANSIDASVILNALWCAFKLCVVTSEEEICKARYPTKARTKA